MSISFKGHKCELEGRLITCEDRARMKRDTCDVDTLFCEPSLHLFRPKYVEEFAQTCETGKSISIRE